MVRIPAAAFLAGVAALAANTTSTPVTFNKDVLPVLQKNCQGCHRPGEVAPMSFLTYKDTRPWAKSIRAAVLAKKMPPWFADPRYGHFANERKLTEAEINTMVAWADNGAPEGNAKDRPAPVAFVDGWSIGKPDKVFEMPVAYQVPADGVVDYTYFVIPTGFTEDTWVNAAEVRPGNRAVVHHVIALIRPKGSQWMKDAKPGVPFVPRSYRRDANGARVDGAPPAAPAAQSDPQRGAAQTGGTIAASENLVGYAPGLQPQRFDFNGAREADPRRRRHRSPDALHAERQGRHGYDEHWSHLCQGAAETPLPDDERAQRALRHPAGRSELRGEVSDHVATRRSNWSG